MVVFIYIFTLVFTRSILLDIRDVQGDLMVGDETLPILLGKKRTRQIMLSLLVVCSLVLVGSAYSGWVNSLGYYLLIPIGYCFMYLFAYQKRYFSQGIFAEIAANASFFVSGVVALAYHYLGG